VPSNQAMLERGEEIVSETGRILVIDDDESIRKLLVMTLESRGYSVDTAKDGKEAIRKSNSNLYDLAIVDLRLPDMDGIELLTAMKQIAPWMMKIMLTGYPSLESAVEAINKGADGYILKPVKTEQLLSTVQEHLRKQREAKTYSEDKVKEFIETRVRELETRE
jgi:DNA-binding NtrC family response regulator